MSFFSRLTDIVTCNLTEILANESDPEAALQQIIREMEEGLAGADRSVGTARRNKDRFSQDLAEYQQQIIQWTDKARAALADGNEGAARESLMRKAEVEDLIAGLEQQLESAENLLEQLSTTRRALEARLSDARRKQETLKGGQVIADTSESESGSGEPVTETGDSRSKQIEAELDALREELGR